MDKNPLEKPLTFRERRMEAEKKLLEAKIAYERTIANIIADEVDALDAELATKKGKSDVL